MIEKQESFIDLLIGVQVGLLEVLRQICDDARFNVSHLLVDLLSEVAQVLFHLAQVEWRLADRWFKCPKAIALIVLHIAAKATFMDTLNDTFEFTDAFTNCTLPLLRTLLGALALRE